MYINIKNETILVVNMAYAADTALRICQSIDQSLYL